MCLPQPVVCWPTTTAATLLVSVPTLLVSVLGSGPLQGVQLQLTRPDRVTVTATTDANGNASIPLGPPGLYTLKLIPNDGIHKEMTIQLWVNGSGRIVVTLPKIYMALDVVASPSSQGTVSPSGLNEYPAGTVVQVTATPASNSSLLYWLLDGNNVGDMNPITVTMDKPHQLVAVFSQPAPTSGTFAESVSLQAQ
jgi:hypothetical protein